MKSIENLTEKCFDTTKICVNAPYILKKDGKEYIVAVVSASATNISVSYFTDDYTLAIELLTPGMDFTLSIIGGEISTDTLKGCNE